MVQQVQQVQKLGPWAQGRAGAPGTHGSFPKSHPTMAVLLSLGPDWWPPTVGWHPRGGQGWPSGPDLGQAQWEW